MYYPNADFYANRTEYRQTFGILIHMATSYFINTPSLLIGLIKSCWPIAKEERIGRTSGGDGVGIRVFTSQTQKKQARTKGN